MPEIRLIDEKGEKLGIFPTREALRRAQSEGLDLVEVAPTARPPVCRIMDYGKYKYEQAKKRQEAKKRQTVVHVKEIKMRPATQAHDLMVKLNRIREFLEEGCKTKVTVQFKGREMAHKELGRKLLERVVMEVAPLGVPEQMPRQEGRFLSVMLQPGKTSKSTTKTKAGKVKSSITTKSGG